MNSNRLLYPASHIYHTHLVSDLWQVHDIFDHVAARQLPPHRPFSTTTPPAGDGAGDTGGKSSRGDETVGFVASSSRRGKGKHREGSDTTLSDPHQVSATPSRATPACRIHPLEHLCAQAPSSAYYRSCLENAHKPPQDFTGFVELLAEMAHACYPGWTMEQSLRQLVQGDVMAEVEVPRHSPLDRRRDAGGMVGEEAELLTAQLTAAVEARGSHGIATLYDTEAFGHRSAVFGESWRCTQCGTVSTVRWLDLGGDRGAVPHPFSRCSGEGCGRSLQEQQALQNEVEGRMQELHTAWSRAGPAPRV
jgi:hypothetical protein